MKVYVEAQSKAALIRRLAAGEEITGLNYSMFGGGGYYKLDNTLEDGTIIAIYSQMSGGNPVAKSWGTWTNGVLKAETFEAEQGWVSGPDAEPHPDLFDGMLLDEYQQVLDEWEGDENPPSLEEYFNEDYWKARDKYDREEEIAYNKYMEYLSTLTEEEAMEEMYGAETFEGHHGYHAETLMCPICDSVCDHDSQNLYDCSSCEIMWVQDEDGGFDFLEAESIPAGVGVIFK